MMIRRIQIIDIPQRPLLKGLDLSFTTSTDLENQAPQCFIGVNGSGKSQLLETFAEVFLYLDELVRKTDSSRQAPFLFNLEYSLLVDKKTTIVRVEQQKLNKPPLINLLNKDEELLEENISLDAFTPLLPTKVVGYTSGANETLSIPFLAYYDEYAEVTAGRALRNSAEMDYDPRFYLMNYDTNIGVVVSNLLLNRSPHLVNILKVAKIKDLHSFRIKIQLNHRAARPGGIKTTEDIDGWIEKLRKCATCYVFEEDSRTYTLDYYVNDATRAAFNYYFKNALELYTALYKIELLNNLILDKSERDEIKRRRKSRNFTIKPPTIAERNKVLSYQEVKLIDGKDKILEYISLSDGEHQYLNVFGTVLMLGDYPNTLFLLDEPETHFNPKWRREFIKVLDGLMHEKEQAYFITSHSPFIVSDSKSENVYVFRNENNKLSVSHPQNETYGSDFDYVLKIAFDMENTVSEKSLEEIRKLQKSNSIEKIEKHLVDFGESTEKFYLYNRIEELQAKAETE